MHIHPLLAYIVRELKQGLETPVPDHGVPDVSNWTNREVLDFIDEARRLADDEYMGLASAQCVPGSADFAIELGARCATLREAIECNCRFMAIATRAFVFALEEADGQAKLMICRPPTDLPAAWAIGDWVMIAWHKLMQWLIGAEVQLEQVGFDHPLTSEYRHYTSMFGSSCTFNQPHCTLAFDRALLDRKVIRQPWEASVLKATTPGYFEQPGLIARSWAQQVRNLMRSEIMAGGAPSDTEALARQFALSGQTLRRRLRLEGTSVRAIRLQVRLEIARDRLASGASTLGEASLAAGFAEPNALARALRNKGMRASDLCEESEGWRKADRNPRD